VIQSNDPIRFENFILHSKHGQPVRVSAVLNSMIIDNEQCVMFLFEVDNIPTIHQASSTQELASFKMGLDETFMLTYLDQDGLITYANTLFLKSSKWTPKRIIGKSFWQLFPEESADKLVNQIWYALKSNRVWQGSVEKLTKEGKPTI
jgi:PAS domain-containing protein